MKKLKKGSKEAKMYMAKLRASKGKKKTVKKKLTGEKHTDIKSHNYKINIGNLQQNLVEQLKHKISMLNSWQKVLKTLQENYKLEKDKLNKTMYRNDIYRTKNVIKNLKTEIKNLKRTI